MRQLHHASRSPRVRYPPKQRLCASASIYLSTPPLYNPPLPPAASARQVLRASATLVEGQRNTWRAAPRVRYSARQVPAESGCRMAAPRVRYSARQVPTRSRSRASATSYLFSPPLPPSPLSATLLAGINEYVASGSARQVLRASATCRERSERM